MEITMVINEWGVVMLRMKEVGGVSGRDDSV